MKCMLCSVLVCKGEESPCTSEGHTGSNQTKVQPGDVQAGNWTHPHMQHVWGCTAQRWETVGRGWRNPGKQWQAAVGAKSQEVEIWEYVIWLYD